MALAVDTTARMDTDLHHNAVNILLALYDTEDETATTTQIGTVTGLSSANISGNHAQTLEQQQLIERAGSVESNAPNATNVYKLTHRGRKEAKRLLNQTDVEVPMSDGEKLALLNFVKENRHAIEAYAEGMEGDTSSAEDPRVDEIVERLDNQEDRIDELHSSIKKTVQRMSRIMDKVNDLKQEVK